MANKKTNHMLFFCPTPNTYLYGLFFPEAPCLRTVHLFGILLKMGAMCSFMEYHCVCSTVYVTPSPYLPHPSFSIASPRAEAQRNSTRAN